MLVPGLYTIHIMLKRQEQNSPIFSSPGPNVGFNGQIPSHTAARINKGSGSWKNTNLDFSDYKQGVHPTYPYYTPTSPKS